MMDNSLAGLFGAAGGMPQQPATPMPMQAQPPGGLADMYGAAPAMPQEMPLPVQAPMAPPSPTDGLSPQSLASLFQIYPELMSQLFPQAQTAEPFQTEIPAAGQDLPLFY